MEAKDFRVLIACEESQAVCKAFRERGFEAYSNDLQDCSGGHPEWHLQMDCYEALTQHGPWHLVITHIECTFFCNSGVRWLVSEDKAANAARLEQMLAVLQLWNKMRDYCLTQGIPLAMENPIPHKYAVNGLPPYVQGIGKYTQLIQPWQFGHGETKATCLWLYGLPDLIPTNVVGGREQRIWKLPPDRQGSKGARAKARSKTLQGIADAFAGQWGNYLLSTIKTA